MASKPVAIIMGSQSDWATMKHAAKTSMTCDRLRGTNRFGAPDAQAAVRICQQRAQERVQGDYRRRRRRRPSPRDDRVNDPPAGLRRADEHPRLGRQGLAPVHHADAGGIPVGTLAIGKAGAINAALLAAAVLALSDVKTAKRLDGWRAQQTRSVAKRPKD